MAARKAPAKSAASEMSHKDECTEARMEAYTAARRDGSDASVVRCQECGVQTVK